jgi:S-adenosylmethionine-dependent methyltransferase
MLRRMRNESSGSSGEPFSWDDAAASWEAGDTTAHGRLRLDLIRRELTDLKPSPRRVLDVGTGTGETAAVLANSGADVVLSDVSSEMLRRAAVCVGPDRCTVVQADLMDLATESIGAFDLVLCHNVLAYLPDLDAAIAVLSDLLEPGGRLSLVTSNSDGEPIRRAIEDHDLAGARRWVTQQATTRRGITFDHPMWFHRLEELRDTLHRHHLRTDVVRGLNIVAPYLPAALRESDYAELIELEAELGAHPEYWPVAVHLHVIATRE